MADLKTLIAQAQGDLNVALDAIAKVGVDLNAIATALPPPSPDGTSVTSVLGGSIIDNSDNVWWLAAGNRGNDNPPQQIVLNGAVQKYTGAVVELYKGNGLVYQQNSDKNWWVWHQGEWVATSSPISPPISPPVSGVPPQAAAAGYNRLAFSDEFTDPSTLSSGDTIGSGQKWCSPSNSPTGPLNGGKKTITNSVLSLSDGAWVQSINGDGTGGFTLAGGGYMEAVVAFDSTLKGDSAFWTMSAEHLQAWSGKGSDHWPGAAPNFTHFAEIDIAEMPGGFTNGFDGAFQDWFGEYLNNQYAKASNNPAFSTDQFGKHIPTPFSNYWITPPGADLTKFHKYGWLWVPSVNGSVGFAQIFFDDQPTPAKVTWIGPAPTYSGVTPGMAPWTWAIIDNHHFPIYIGSANEPAVMQIDSVKVWVR